MSFKKESNHYIISYKSSSWTEQNDSDQQSDVLFPLLQRQSCQLISQHPVPRFLFILLFYYCYRVCECVAGPVPGRLEVFAGCHCPQSLYIWWSSGVCTVQVLKIWLPPMFSSFLAPCRVNQDLLVWHTLSQIMLMELRPLFILPVVLACPSLVRSGFRSCPYCCHAVFWGSTLTSSTSCSLRWWLGGYQVDVQQASGRP